MASQSDVDRLRAQNLSLIKQLQNGQHNLRASVRSAVGNRGSPFQNPKQGVLRDKPSSKSNIQRQRDRRGLASTSSIPHEQMKNVLQTHLTSTPKCTVSSTVTSGSADRVRDPFAPRPVIDPVRTDVPNRLYESFLSESKSVFGRQKEKSPKGRAVTSNQVVRKTPGSGRKSPAGVTKKGARLRKSPKAPRPGTSVPVFTPSPDGKRPNRPHSVQLETSSLLPPPVSDIENRGHQGSRFGHRPPLDLAHELSYYQLNKDSPMGTGQGQPERSFAGQLLADGNNRTQSRRSQDIIARPKSILLTPGTRMNKSRNRVSFCHSPNVSTAFSADDSIVNRTQPLLGYDWIAGLLDSDQPASEHSEEFFEELRQFRQANREECVHKSLTEDPDALSASFQMESRMTADDDEIMTDAAKHTCIHNYTLNSRLFAVPLHGTQRGESLCAICNDRRKAKEPGTSSPSYIRVSIPRSTLASPYRIRPHRRKSYDPTDSVGLSQHCLAGWESSKPSMLPTASNIDLKDSVDVMASNALNLMSYPMQEPYRGSEKASRISRHTQDLLNRSHSLRLDLQKLERVGMSVAQLPPGPHSTSYPVL